LGSAVNKLTPRALKLPESLMHLNENQMSLKEHQSLLLAKESLFKPTKTNLKTPKLIKRELDKKTIFTGLNSRLDLPSKFLDKKRSSPDPNEEKPTDDIPDRKIENPDNASVDIRPQGGRNKKLTFNLGFRAFQPQVKTEIMGEVTVTEGLKAKSLTKTGRARQFTLKAIQTLCNFKQTPSKDQLGEAQS
jgi:hypothetical protein